MSEIEHVQNGDRVYLGDTNQFGDVAQKGFLGIKKSVVMTCDDGTLKAYCGQPALDNVVSKGTGENGNGVNVDLPTDVKQVGPTILSSLGIPEEDQAALFQKFMTLPTNVRQEKVQYWMENNSDAVKMETFFTDLLSLLQTDDWYVEAEAQILLKHLDEGTRQSMVESLMSSTTIEERKALILLFTEMKNSRHQIKEFGQMMYERFMDDRVYLKMELKSAIANVRVFDPKASEMIDRFLSDTSDTTVAEIVQHWRSQKIYDSITRTTYAQRYLKPYQ